MPNSVDLFPQNYGVTHNPLDRLSMDPMQFINGVETPFGGTAANPIGNPLQLAITGLDGLINMGNMVIEATIPGTPALIPTITQLVTLLQPCLSAGGLLSGFFSGVPFVNLLFGGLTGTGPGSGTGLFGTSTLFNPGGLFSGLASGIPLLSQLIGAAGGNSSATNLLSEFVSIFTGSGGGASFAQLISMFTNIIPGLTGLSGLTSIFTDIVKLIGNPTSLGSGTPGLPGIGSIPVLGGLLGGGSILGSLIPSLDASKIVSGILGLAQIPGLPASQVTSGVFGLGLIPSLTSGWGGTIASTLLSGVLGTGLIPTLDASKIGSGVFGTGLIPNITTAMSSDLQGVIDNIYQAINGGISTGNTVASVKTGLLAFPGANLIGSVASSLLSGTIGSGLIPTLDGSKIGSGTVGSSFLPSTPWFSSIASSLLSGVISQSLIPSLTGAWGNTIAGSLLTGSVASSLLSGVLGTGLIPTLDASKIGSGIFGTGQIPGLPASQITSGIFGTGLIPNLDAAILTSGTLASGLIPALDGSKIGSGTVSSSFLPSTSWFSSIPGSSLTGTVAESVTGLSTLRDAITAGLGLVGSGFSNTQAQNQAVTVQQTANAAAASAAQANATLAAQNAVSTANNAAGGSYFNIAQTGADGSALSADYGSTGPTAGDLCIRGPNSYIGIKAGNADGTYWAVGASTRQYATDNQSLALVLGDQGGSTSAPLIGYFHCDSGFTVGGYCRIDNGSITIGSFTRSGSTFTYTPFTGGSYSGNISGRVEVHNVGTAYTIVLNGNVVKSVTAAGVTMDATHRYWAISMTRLTTSGGWFSGPQTYDAFRATQVSVADYVQPTFVGSGASMTRTVTTAVTPTAGLRLFPTSFFGITAFNTSDITVDLVNGKFTVTVEGWYLVNLNVALNTTSALTNQQYRVVLYKNGAAYRNGIMGYRDATDSIANQAWGDKFLVYLKNGDNVQAGMNWTVAAPTLIGTVAPESSYFEIALLTRSLA